MANVAELKEGERFDSFFKIREYEARQSRAGREYLDLMLEDSTGEVPAKVWEPATQVQGGIRGGRFHQGAGHGGELPGALAASGWSASAG